MKEPAYCTIISKKLALKELQVSTTLSLLKDLNTVPFIARYRKEATGGLDETQIRDIIKLNTKETNLYEHKTHVLKIIYEQGKLTPDLRANIESAITISDVDDYYAPFKKKRETKADVAIKRGFEKYSQLILSEISTNQLIAQVKKDNVPFSIEEVIEGAKDIVVQKLVDDVKVKNHLRKILQYASLSSASAKIKDDMPDKIKEQKHKFEIYSKFTIRISSLKPYQTLALNRGEDLKLLKVSLTNAALLAYTNYFSLKLDVSPLRDCIEQTYKKQFKSVEIEIRNALTEKATLSSIALFKENLQKLLLIKPNYGETVLAIDPGFRTGCKLAILDKETKPIAFSKITILSHLDIAKKIVTDLLQTHKVDVIVLGNGTASNETYDFLKGFVTTKMVVVSESGASVYSASPAAKNEFPNQDITERGTISIGRRYVDPLAELVKIPTQSIGVGMYQHDINQKLLSIELAEVVEDTVNLVGINLNTATPYVLSHISGLTRKSAEKIVAHKPYANRQGLVKVLSKKAFEQAAGFLRIIGAEELDNTNIHPEQYTLAKCCIACNFDLSEVLVKFASSTQVTLDTIKESLRVKEHRIYDGNLKIESTLKMEELKVGDVLQGIVRNIMPFGVFVDIGVKNNGLIHISELADTFVKDPSEHVSIGENIKVKIFSLDLDKGKIGLSRKGI